MSPTSRGTAAISKDGQPLLAFTFFGVFVEISMCAWGLSSGLSLWLTPFVLAHFHAGYILAPKAERCRWFPAGSLAATGMVILGASVIGNWWMLSCVALLLFSTSLQVLRRRLKGSVRLKSAWKNICKALAMLAGSAGALPAGAFAVVLWSVGLVVVCLSVQVHRNRREEPREQAPPSNRALLWFEGLHHAHYFAYVYVFWALLTPSLRAWLGPFFVVGWLGYFLMERLLREERGKFRIHHMIIGHIVCAGAIAAMLSNSSVAVVLLLWFVTGAAGGTAYMLDRCQNGGNRELFEDSGHIIGCLAAALGLLVCDRVEIPLLTASAFAVAAAAVLVFAGFGHEKETSL